MAIGRVVIIIAPENFRDEEYFVPKEILEKGRVDVVTASTIMGIAVGKLGGQAQVDMLLKDVNPDEFNAVIYVGGPGCRQLFDNTDAHRIARIMYNYGKITAAICSSVVIIARAGILKGKKSTVWHGDADLIKQEGAVYTAADVEQDGNIITGCGPNAAKEFGERVLEAISKSK